MAHSRTPDTSFLTRRALCAGVAGLAVLAAAPALVFAQGAVPATEWDEGYDNESGAAAVRNSGYPTISQLTVQSLEQAIQQYSAIAQQGGWPGVPEGETLKLGSRSPSVAALRDRLIISGDLEREAGRSNAFDSYVEAAVKRYQARHGLIPDGIVRGATLRAMNVPAAIRVRQLETNLVRVRAMSGFLGNRYIVMNIPAAQLEAVENGVVVSRHVTVVGKIDRQSPIISTKVADINFNPYWTVPASIIRKDLIPKMQNEPEYLSKNRIRAFNPRTGQEVPPESINWRSDEATHYMFRQDPGELNSMGNVRINIPNPHQVYMHDTPSKGLFGEDARFHSSGCARIQNVRELVAWILKGTQWDRSAVDEAFRSGQRMDARPAAPVPVYWVYVTAWANPDGVVQFRDDIYNRDGLGLQAKL